VADPRLAEGLIRVLNHDVAPSKVFKPSLAMTTTARALLTSRGRRRAVLQEARAIVANEVRRRAWARRPKAAATTTAVDQSSKRPS
jgi:hypothetical protein